MRKIKNQFKYYFLGLLFLATVFVWYAVFAESRQGLEVDFLDVGQGDAIFIQAPNGNQVLVDGGPNNAVLRELSKVMPFYDRSLDMIIESHPDSDHINGLVEVLKNYKTDLVMEPGVESENAAYQELKNLIREKNIPYVFARRGMRVLLDDGLYLDILFPDRDVSGWDTNDASIVAKLVYGNDSFLLTADSPDRIEKFLVSLDGNRLKSNVLKVAHHGSRTSTSEMFLSYVKPDYAVISVGKNNKYNHPHQETLDRLSQFQIPILRTDELGTIKIKSDGEKITVAN
jgi:competence protein ComEC